MAGRALVAASAVAGALALPRKLQGAEAEVQNASNATWQNATGADELKAAFSAGGLKVKSQLAGSSYNLRQMGPPPTALAYDGMEWPKITVSGDNTHFFAIGDWGGMDGSFDPGEGRSPVVAYAGGGAPGPHVFPRSRWNKQHSELLCSHKEFIACFDTKGAECAAGCGFVPGIDTQPQQLVAAAFNARVGKSQPAFVLNVGDNFYWGGIEKTCGTPMGSLSFQAQHQFNTVFNGVYAGSAPWISALGNHDYGGRQFINGWDQQIAYTWKNPKWIMPASYYMVTVDFVDQGFTADIFVLDSNKEDAKGPGEDPEHNICGPHNPEDASCAAADGPTSLADCQSWFHDRWAKQQAWLEEKLAKSSAQWQIVVTHFPCGTDGGWYSQLHQRYGLDLLVTGHRHDQELWEPSRMGGLTCFVTGGGGGITSEATPDPEAKEHWYGEAQYGFYDLAISRDLITIESINYDGKVVKKATVRPTSGR